MNEATTPPKRRPGRRLLRIAGLLFAVVLIFDVWDRCYHPVFFGVGYLVRTPPWPSGDYRVDQLTPSIQRAHDQGYTTEMQVVTGFYTTHSGAKIDHSTQVLQVKGPSGAGCKLARIGQTCCFAIRDGVVYRECLGEGPGVRIEALDVKTGVTNWTVQFGDWVSFTQYFGSGYRMDASRPDRLFLEGFEANGYHLYLLDTKRTTNGAPVLIDTRHYGEIPGPWKASLIDRLSTMIWYGLQRTQRWLDD